MAAAIQAATALLQEPSSPTFSNLSLFCFVLHLCPLWRRQREKKTSPEVRKPRKRCQVPPGHAHQHITLRSRVDLLRPRYRLDALLKLATVKSVDGKRTLMNYLADWCRAHEPALLEVAGELPTAATTASRYPLTAWSSAFKGVQTKVESPPMVLYFHG